MKKFFLLSVFIFSILFPTYQATAASVNAYLFYGDTCPHCAEEEEFLKKIAPNYPDLTVYGYEVYHNRTNVSLMKEVGKKLGADTGGVPFLIIGDKYFIGFAKGITDKEIINKMEEISVSGYFNPLTQIMETALPDIIITANGQPTKNPEPNTDESKTIKLPFLGETDISKFSLPMLAIILGTLDGFNPCAMWVLLFLISFLLGLNNRKRMWILGSVFIVASALVYFIFMAAWLNLILFLGFIIWIRVIIALVALGGGIYNIKEYFTNKAGVCKITDGERQQKVFEKLKSAVNQQNFLLAICGIVLLAFMVNLVELVCSAGLPAIFTQVLTLNNLTSWQYYGYILLYIFFFMIDDLLVFFIAMTTFKITGITTKYTRYSHIIGGILMLFIGIALLFKPEWLMF